MGSFEDVGDIEDLRVRLGSFRGERRSRLVPVIGSGPSNSVLPDVQEMIQVFREAIPVPGRPRFDSTIGPLGGTPLGYQNAASLVKRQAGDPALARAVRKAVLSACTSVSKDDRDDVARDEDECRRLVAEGDWNVPEAYVGLTRFYESLDGARTGPILTTNFDPLIEVAFRNAGMQYTPIPIPFDSVPTPEQLRDQAGVPIIHFHGYWTSKATLSTIPQLTKDRPALEGLLRILLRNSTVLVTGYSGWEDAFMRSLARRVTGEDLDLLDAEILWSCFSADPSVLAGSGLLGSLNGSPGFTLYLGVDAHQLFDPTLSSNHLGDVRSAPTPFGFTIPASQAKVVEPRHFADGAHPEWGDAQLGVWPRLGSTEELWQDLSQSIEDLGGGGAIAIGPMGEGKSLAIRQLALRVQQEQPSWYVLWREVGAPRITTSWLKTVRAAHEKVLICADDADLIASELVATQSVWRESRSGISFLLASQDRLWWQDGAALRDSITPTVFHGLSEDDSRAIADAWVRLDVTPGRAPKDIQDAAAYYAGCLTQSANVLMSGEKPTLFGSILDVRHGDLLGERVADLVEKLTLIKIAKDGTVNLADIFGGICLLQVALDENGTLHRGASRPIISAMAGLSSEYADGKILDSLGREAAVSFAGSQVYARHPSIARSAVDHLRATNRTPHVARLLGLAGGRLLEIGGLADVDFRQAYLLGRDLHIEAEARGAATGAVEGARTLLEPRVSLLRVTRGFDSARAAELARGYAPHVHEFRDFGPRVRSFLTEYAHAARLTGEPQFGIGLAALAIDDGSGFYLDAQRASYALSGLVSCARSAEAQIRGNDQPVSTLARVALERVRGVEVAEDLLGRSGDVRAEIGQVRALSDDALGARLRTRLSADAAAAHARTGVQVAFDGALRLNDLRRLFRGA